VACLTEYDVVAKIWGSWNLQHLGDPPKNSLLTNYGEDEGSKLLRTSVTIYESTRRLMTEDMNFQRLCRQTVFIVWRFVAEAQCAYVR
jgi:hypothetical protein